MPHVPHPGSCVGLKAVPVFWAPVAGLQSAQTGCQVCNPASQLFAPGAATGLGDTGTARPLGEPQPPHALTHGANNPIPVLLAAEPLTSLDSLVLKPQADEVLAV